MRVTCTCVGRIQRRSKMKRPQHHNLLLYSLRNGQGALMIPVLLTLVLPVVQDLFEDEGHAQIWNQSGGPQPGSGGTLGLCPP